MKRRVLVRRVTKELKKKVISVFDIETEGLGGAFLQAAIYDGENVTFFASSQEMLDWMIAHPKVTYFAHNGGNYDFHYLLNHFHTLLTQGWNITFSHQGDKIIGATFLYQYENKKGKPCVTRFTIADSFPLLSTSLKKITKMFAPEYEKHDIGLGRGVIYDPSNAEHREYLAYDCMGLYHALHTFRARVHDLFGADIGLTAGSTAMKCFLATLPEGYVYFRLHPDQEAFCREAYYGGYVYPGKDMLVHEDVTSVDYNAAYAAVQRNEYPVGIAIYTNTRKVGKLGIYRVNVTTPPYDTLHFPCLPVRKENKTYWAAGTFETCVTSVEIDFAVAHGYTIDIIEGYYWKKQERVFIHFVDLCEQLELELAENKDVTKIMRNSLYGKFGTRTQTQHMVMTQTLEEGMTPVIDGNTGMPVEYVALVDDIVDEPYIQPHWAAFVTAYQRLKLIEAMECIGYDHVFYGDTDSIKASKVEVERVIEQGHLVVSRRFGDVKVDGQYEQFQSFGPKNYRYIEQGKKKWRIKGIPFSAIEQRNEQQERTGEVKAEYFAQDPSQEVIQPSFDGLHSFASRLKRPTLPMYSPTQRTIGSMYTAHTWNYEHHHVYPVAFP